MRTKSASNPRATIEICLVDEMTRLPVALGHVILEERPSSATLFDQEVAGSGCVSIDADPGSYLLRLAASGYISVVQSLDLNSNEDHVFKNIPMVRVKVFHGIVRNAAGEPQPGANVIVVAHGYRRTILSGVEGGFEISLPSSEIDRIYAFKPPHPVAEVGPISIGGPNKSFIEITLPKEAAAFKITARIFDDQARPVKGALVRVLGTTGFHVADKEDDLVIQAAQGVSGISDADGRCTLEVLPQHDVVLQVAGIAGCEPANESLDVAENVTKDVHLTCHAMFRVKVQDAGGRTIEGANVVAETRSGTEAIRATSERDRYYALEYPFRIYARTASVREADAGVTKDAWIEKYQEEIRLVLGQGRLDGLVMDEAGEPVRSFQVRVHQSGEDSFDAVFPFLSEDGSFSLHHLPAGTVSVEVIGESSVSGTALVASYTEDVIVAEGQCTHVRAVIKPSDQSEGDSSARRRRQ
jgi:hypothetical protein